MKWRDMLVWGGLVSAEWQADAWYQTRQRRTLRALEGRLRATYKKSRDAPPDPGMEFWYYQEIASRMRQRARKAGLIAYDRKSREWDFLGDGESDGS